jgi:hypothetical protein
LPKGEEPQGVNAEVSTDTDQRPIELALADGAVVDDLLSQARGMGMPVEQVQEILLDGHSVDRRTPLRDGAAVTLVGQVQGV